MLSVKGIIDDVSEDYMSHKEKYENAVRKAVLYSQAMRTYFDDSMPFEERIK